MRKLLWIMLGIGVTGIALSALLAWLFPPSFRASRVVLSVALAPGTPLTDEYRGMVPFIKLCLEAVSGTAVVDQHSAVDPQDPPSVLMHLTTKVEGDLVSLWVDLTTPHGRKESLALGPASLRVVMEDLVKRLDMDPTGLNPLLPQSPQLGTLLLRALGSEDMQDYQAALEGLLPALKAEPGCALLHEQAGSMVENLLLRAALPSTVDPLEAQGHFRKALELDPDNPYLVARDAHYRIHTGEIQSALDSLCEVRYPSRSLSLLTAKAYAARVAGLLEAALRIQGQRDRISGPVRWASTVGDNTWLYTGQWARFEESLGVLPGPDEVPLRDFYRGYIRLIRGRSSQAVTYFQRCLKNQDRKGRFPTLASVYHAHLTGQSEEARTELLTFWKEQRSQRVGDGEFLFKIAEAFSVLGFQEEALEAAERAFAMGFSCLRWYQESPLLDVLQTHPRWKALLQRVRERQSILEARFPVERLGS